MNTHVSTWKSNKQMNELIRKYTWLGEWLSKQVIKFMNKWVSK